MSHDYVQAFKARGIIPIIISSTNSKIEVMKPFTPPVEPATEDLSAYNKMALYMSESRCPNLFWDPWTSYVCSKYSSSICFPPETPLQAPRPTHSLEEEGSYNNGYTCDDYACAMA